ncbi:hypothetical protein WJX77_001940 [Trebouxia sp. C0004]
MAQAICHPNPSRRCHIPQTAHSLQHRPSKHRHRLYAQFQSAHDTIQRAAGQHATAPGHAASVIAAAQQPIAAAPKQQTGNEHLDGKLKIIGVGNRGSSAVGRLIKNGKVSGAEMWCLDHDRKVLEGSGTANVVVVRKEEPHMDRGSTPLLSPEDMQRIVGPGAYDQHGKGNVNVGDGGVAFLLASAGTIPGGAPLLLSLVNRLRETGHFTAVSVTRPFEFEGQRKVDAADRMIAALEESAHLVVVVEQDVLSKAAGGSAMTVAEATNIADNALEHTVRTILASLQAPEILKSTSGALIWHGRDLRRYKRLLSPPLQRLLTCPGTAALGRGVASMPASYAHQMGPGQSLMHLASDAVRAAAESPFLEEAVRKASAILCCISMPSPKQRFAGDNGDMIVMHSLRDYDAEKSAGRMAVQAAAGALMSVTGHTCQDIVMCSTSREWDDMLEEDDGGRTVKVEVSLLVLRLPPGVPLPAPASAAAAARNTLAVVDPAATSSEEADAAQRSNGSSQGKAAASTPAPRQRLPSSSWTAMSAMAGGTRAVPARPRDADESPQGSRDEPAGISLPASASMWHANLPDISQRSVNAAAKAAALASVGDKLVDSLQAQSLDLPPQAAKWRQKVRRPEHKLIVKEAGEEPTQPEAETVSGGFRNLLQRGQKKEVDVRERTSGILLSDRTESWDQ